MFSRSVNDTSRAYVVGDNVTWILTTDNSIGVIYDNSIFMTQFNV
jgi:hypothetical protein